MHNPEGEQCTKESADMYISKSPNMSMLQPLCNTFNVRQHNISNPQKYHVKFKNALQIQNTTQLQQ